MHIALSAVVPPSNQGASIFSSTAWEWSHCRRSQETDNVKKSPNAARSNQRAFEHRRLNSSSRNLFDDDFTVGTPLRDDFTSVAPRTPRSPASTSAGSPARPSARGPPKSPGVSYPNATSDATSDSRAHIRKTPLGAPAMSSASSSSATAVRPTDALDDHHLLT